MADNPFPPIPFPPELIQLDAPGSIVSSYHTIHGRVSFNLPITADIIADLDHLVMVVLSSKLPEVVQRAVCGFRMQVSRYYGHQAPGPAPLHDAAILNALAALQNQMVNLQNQMVNLQNQMGALRADSQTEFQDLRRDVVATRDRLEIRAANCARSQIRQGLLPLPAVHTADNELPPAFADRAWSNSRQIAALPDRTLNQILEAYGLDPQGMVNRAQKSSAIWVYLGGDAIIHEMNEESLRA